MAKKKFDYVVLCPHLAQADQIGGGGGITKRDKQIFYYCRECWQKQKEAKDEEKDE